MNFSGGKLGGVNKECYENGNLKEEVTFSNGKPEGMSKGYYESGKLKEEIEL